MREPLIGAHMSIAGGLFRALERGQQAGCRTVQLFLKSSNQWKAKPLTDEDRASFRQLRQSSGIDPIVAHDSYLINLASPDPDLYEKSLQAFVVEMERAGSLGIPFLVLHPGAHMGSGIDAGVSAVAAALNRAIDQVDAPVAILLENTAGQGSSLGHGFEELASILAQIKHRSRVGICLDTCHAFAAGYDIRTAEGYEATMREFDRLIGLESIRVLHLNDSKKGLGSRVDRHAHIGQGSIGLEAFRFLINDRRFEKIPKILETPKGTGSEDARNLAILRSLVVVKK